MYPESFARFYDVIYHSVRDGVDNEFFSGQAILAKGSVLEAGVGTGRLFMKALEKGVDIHGIDISPTMISILLSKLPVEHHERISRQSITSFSFDKRFSLIMAPFRVFMHLENKEEQLAAINNVYDHLEENGRFIFDLFIPDLNQLLKGLDRKVDFEGEYAPGKMLRRTVSTFPDLVNQIIRVHFHLEWEENGQIKSDDWIVNMRFYFRYELEHLIERSKFSSYEIAGDYNGKPLSADSKEFIVICKK